MSAQTTLGASIRRGTLSERQREVLGLVEDEGLTPQEAADALGLQPSTLRTHLHRARQKMEGN